MNDAQATPSIPCWTSANFFSLTTRPGLCLPPTAAAAAAATPRLSPQPSHQLLRPLTQDRNPHRVASSASVFPSKKRKLSVWHDAPASEASGAGLKRFEAALPALQRAAWVSFPSSLTAPVPFSCVRSLLSENDLSAPAPTPYIPSGRVRARDACRGSVLSNFKISDRNVFLVSPSGELSSLAAYTLDGDVSTGLRLKNHACCARIPDIIAFDRQRIHNVASVPCDDGTRLIATTSDSACVARITGEGTLTWDDHLTVPGIRASALNPVFPEEVSILSSEGLFTGTADEYRSLQSCADVYPPAFYDVQCLQPESQFRQVEYGTHPRAVLLASHKQLIQHDLRARRARLTVYDLQSNPKTQALEAEIGTFCLAPNNGFHVLLATRASLTYLDVRRPEVPLLDWSLVLPTAPDKIAAAPLNPDGMRSDAVALACSRWGHIDVYHAVHTGGDDTLSPFHEIGERDSFCMPRVDMVWSDLPLRRFSSRPFQDSVDGITVMTDYGDRRAAVMQWSDNTGLTVHPFEVAPGLDGDGGADEHGLRTKPENSINLRNSVWSLGPFSNRGCCCDRFPVSRSIPGSYLHGRVKRLLLKDVIEVRKRICFQEDDDSDNVTRVPRPYMQDLVSSEKNNGDTKFTTSGPEETLPLQPYQPDEAARGDVAAGRETILGEAALLRLEESDDSENPEPRSMDFIDAIGSGCLFDELSRSVRSGFGHHPMPIGVSELKEAISDSPLTKSYETVWHTQCQELHSAYSTAVSTADTVPSWLCTTVYFAEEAQKGESLRNSSIPESSQYGALLARMKTEFFT